MSNEEMATIFTAPFFMLCDILKDSCKENDSKKEERAFVFNDCTFKLSCELTGENNAK